MFTDAVILGERQRAESIIWEEYNQVMDNKVWEDVTAQDITDMVRKMINRITEPYQ